MMIKRSGKCVEASSASRKRRYGLEQSWGIVGGNGQATVTFLIDDLVKDND